MRREEAEKIAEEARRVSDLSFEQRTEEYLKEFEQSEFYYRTISEIQKSANRGLDRLVIMNDEIPSSPKFSYLIIERAFRKLGYTAGYDVGRGFIIYWGKREIEKPKSFLEKLFGL